MCPETGWKYENKPTEHFKFVRVRQQHVNRWRREWDSDSIFIPLFISPVNFPFLLRKKTNSYPPIRKLQIFTLPTAIRIVHSSLSAALLVLFHYLFCWTKNVGLLGAALRAGVCVARS